MTQTRLLASIIHRPGDPDAFVITAAVLHALQHPRDKLVWMDADQAGYAAHFVRVCP